MQRAIEQAVTHILKHMKVWQKLGFLGVVFLIPLAIFSYKMIASMRAMGVNFAQREALGIEYLLPLQSLVEDVQQHRDLAAGLLNGDPSFAEKLAAKRDEIRADMQLVHIVNKELGAILNAAARWEAFRATLSRLLDTTAEEKAQENFEHHTKLIKELLSFLVYVGDQ